MYLNAYHMTGSRMGTLQSLYHDRTVNRFYSFFEMRNLYFRKNKKQGECAY